MKALENTGNAAPATASRLRLGIAGFGTAGRSMLPAIAAHPGCELAAIADASHSLREEIGGALGAAVYPSLASMLGHRDLDAVYIATPTELHREHVLLAVAAKKHVLVEKPMAENLQRAMEMAAAAEEAGVVCLVGHSHGYDMPVKAMRDLIVGGTLGRVRMVNTWCYSDWMHRPRRVDELDARLGGGVTYRQGSHQFDILRLLCGGMVRSVRAKTFDWRTERRGIGAHMVFLDFEDGAAATAIYNGYGGFDSAALCFNIGESGFSQPPRTGPRPGADGPRMSAQAERHAKQERARNANWGPSPHQPFFGLTVVSCERGDIRQSPQGLTVYTDEGPRDIPLATDRSPRDLVLAELYDAISRKAPALHDARWGLANLEVCDAAIASSASGSDVLLRHQVRVRPGA